MEDATVAKGMHRQNDASRSLSERVLEAVADEEGVEPWELDVPLYEVVDPDALDELFPPTLTVDGAAHRSVTFTYHGYAITVTGDEIDVRER